MRRTGLSRRALTTCSNRSWWCSLGCAPRASVAAGLGSGLAAAGSFLRGLTELYSWSAPARDRESRLQPGSATRAVAARGAESQAHTGRPATLSCSGRTGLCFGDGVLPLLVAVSGLLLVGCLLRVAPALERVGLHPRVVVGAPRNLGAPHDEVLPFLHSQPAIVQRSGAERRERELEGMSEAEQCAVGAAHVVDDMSGLHVMGHHARPPPGRATPE